MEYKISGRFLCLLLGAALLTTLTLTARGKAASPRRETALGNRAVTVTDWETNRQYSYDGLLGAVQQMAARFPWSRAAVTSPTGERITLTRINTSWRAAPEEAVVVELSPPTTPPSAERGNALAFAGLAAFRAYRDRHRDEIPPDAAPTPLVDLPARFAAAAPSPAEPALASAPTLPPAAATESAEGPAAETGLADVPPTHWAAKYVETVHTLGLMKGYPDGTFRGDQPVTRYEMAAILARLVEEGAVVVTEPPQATPPSASPAQPSPAAPSAPAAQGKPAAAPAVEERAARPSLLGPSGLLATPDARGLPAGTGAAVVGGLNDKFLGAVSVGIGDNIEVGAASAWLRGRSQLFLSAKGRLESLSRPGLAVAAGLTGVGSDTAVYGVGTYDLRLGYAAAEVTLGLGSGGILRGPFGGVAVPVGGRFGPVVRSVSLVGESANLGDGRRFNYGLDVAMRRGLNLKVGRVDGDFAAGLSLEGGL